MHYILLGDENDDEEGNIVDSSKTEIKPALSPKWPTRVFAMECTRMILEVCKDHKNHTDLAQARMLKDKNTSGMFQTIVTQWTRN